MANYILEHYYVFKSLHLISVISWMAALLYLPRLLVYQSDVPVGSERDKMLTMMSYRLSKYIMTPAMIASTFFGSLLWYVGNLGKWIHLKGFFLLALFFFHGKLLKWVKEISSGNRPHSSKFFRFANEVPTILMIVIVFMAVLKPF
jgi:putative membrane protein